MKADNRPWYWIPVLNFASGFPYVIIISVSVLMYKNLGISNEDIGLYTSLLYLPWVIKPLWSPFIDLYGTKRNWFLTMQFLISIAFIIVGFIIPTSHFFVLSLAVFWVAAFASASNDVASDGFYMLALRKEQQSFFLGIRSTFYRASMLTGNGLIILLAGYLEHRFGNNQQAWSYTMIFVGLVMTILTVYNYFATPKAELPIAVGQEEEKNFSKVFISFFKKKQIVLILAFILLFRLGESQLLKMLTPFLVDPINDGGMGLQTEDVGIIYGTFGLIALTIGGILGGIVISKDGLGKWMLPMILAMHLPIIGFVLLSHFHPSSVIYIYLTVIAEQFGYGFGFAAFMMYLIYVADGESKTSHYSIATGFMALGMMLPGMVSGYIQDYLGYGNFFIWVFIATIPGLILSRFLIFPKNFGKKTT
ncbi:MFS transporter, PAT family, beta-lactamase induction signal transducer AmpG [Flavobacterium micromati]|jgi:PAT family beta-lactamase induction signal transducer AmpG|uniref:MFS transporter, PAT family, beta-lactamase induction signal transducer AmpG n=1 Tax=Flavobacterium micromati TaxID=229205 RepID=A0A1M5MUM3_9FLAO|nr:MFS transporter [Flavobacterium micromati]SHG81044.1 MFS transporter, PAT family, beta-lactamase induction signal transducer AmpG [Flavobacterium micromati]